MGQAFVIYTMNEVVGVRSTIEKVKDFVNEYFKGEMLSLMENFHEEEPGVYVTELKLKTSLGGSYVQKVTAVAEDFI